MCWWLKAVSSDGATMMCEMRGSEDQFGMAHLKLNDISSVLNGGTSA